MNKASWLLLAVLLGTRFGVATSFGQELDLGQPPAVEQDEFGFPLQTPPNYRVAGQPTVYRLSAVEWNPVRPKLERIPDPLSELEPLPLPPEPLVPSRPVLATPKRESRVTPFPTVHSRPSEPAAPVAETPAPNAEPAELRPRGVAPNAAADLNEPAPFPLSAESPKPSLQIRPASPAPAPTAAVPSVPGPNVTGQNDLTRTEPTPAEPQRLPQIEPTTPTNDTPGVSSFRDLLQGDRNMPGQRVPARTVAQPMGHDHGAVANQGTFYEGEMVSPEMMQGEMFHDGQVVIPKVDRGDCSLGRCKPQKPACGEGFWHIGCFPSAEERANCQRDPNDRLWYTMAEYLYMERQGAAGHTTSYNLNTNAILLNTDALNLGYDDGIRLTVGKIVGHNTMFDVSYSTLYRDGAQISTSPGGGAVGSFFPEALLFPSAFDEADSHVLSYGTEMHNIEAIGRVVSEPMPGITQQLFIGGRFMIINEDLTLDALSTTALVSRSTYAIDTENYLFGPETGIALDIPVRDGLWFSVMGKAGLLLNATKRETALTNYITTIANQGNQVTFSPLVEIGAFFRLELGPRADLRVGYEVLYIGGLALAPEQMDFSTNLQDGINSQSSAYWHGASAGLNLRW